MTDAAEADPWYGEVVELRKKAGEYKVLIMLIVYTHVLYGRVESVCKNCCYFTVSWFGRRTTPRTHGGSLRETV